MKRSINYHPASSLTYGGRLMSLISGQRIGFVCAVLIFASCGQSTFDSRNDEPASVVVERTAKSQSQKLELVDSTLFGSIFTQSKALSRSGIYWTGVRIPTKMKIFKAEFERLENFAQETGISFIQGRADWLAYRSSILATTFVSTAICNEMKSNALADSQSIADGYHLARTDISDSMAAANSCVEALTSSCGRAPAPDISVRVARIGLSKTGGTTLSTILLRSNSRSCVDSANACFADLPLQWVYWEFNSTGSTINSRFYGWRATLTRIATAHKSLTSSSRTSSKGCLP